MESNGKKGLVHISSSTKSILEENYKSDFSFSYDKSIEIRSINQTVESYFVNPKHKTEIFDND